MIKQAIKRAIPPAARRTLEALRDDYRLRRAVKAVSRFRPANGRPHGLPAPVVVSLTSYPARFPTLAMTIKSLLSQTLQPDRVVLWLDTDSPPPSDVTNLASPGLFEIRRCEPMRSYAKIIPALKEWPEAYICTADDDIYYHPDWLEKLVSASEPDVITCRRAHGIRYDGDKRLPYTSWDWCVETASDGNLFPTGCGGVLYPPGSLAPEVLDPLFKELCPTADDVWLYVMGRRAGTRHRQVGGPFHNTIWPGSQEQTLVSVNVDNGNDRQLAAVLSRFGLD